MDEPELRETLRDADIPGAAGARARARRTVLAAHAARPPHTRRRLTPQVLAAAALVIVVASLGATVGPSATAHWVSTTLNLNDRVPTQRAPASLVDLPGGGRLLVNTGDSAWIIGQGPARRIAGITDQVGWSAFGNYLVRVHGKQVQALDTNGRVVWTHRYASTVSFPAWSPDGNRLAFRVGRAIQITAGDGTGSRMLTPRGAQSALRSLPIASSWRPGPRHELAVVDSSRRITLIDADNGELLWRLRAPRDTLSLSWSADGRRLLAVGVHSRRLYGPSGQLLSTRDAAAGTRFTAGQLSPSGRQVALMRTRARAGSGARLDVVLVPAGRPAKSLRLLFAGHDLGDLRFSPTGRWLLVGWHRVDSWLFFATAAGDRRTRLVSAVSRRVGNGEPIVQGWCCSRAQP